MFLPQKYIFKHIPLSSDYIHLNKICSGIFRILNYSIQYVNSKSFLEDWKTLKQNWILSNWTSHVNVIVWEDLTLMLIYWYKMPHWFHCDWWHSTAAVECGWERDVCSTHMLVPSVWPPPRACPPLLSCVHCTDEMLQPLNTTHNTLCLPGI